MKPTQSLIVPASTVSSFRTILGLMLKEEWRQNLDRAKRRHLLLFPVVIIGFTSILVIALQFLLEGGIPGSGGEAKTFTWDEIKRSIHLPIFLFSLGMGAFAFFVQDSIGRRSGSRTMLILTPFFHPLRPNITYAAHYVKEVLFYIGMILIPMMLGMGLGLIFNTFGDLGSPLQPLSIPVTFLALSLTLAHGVALSFALTSIISRGGWLRLVSPILVIVVVLGVLRGPIPLDQALPGLAFQLVHDPIWLFLGIMQTAALVLIGATLLEITERISTSEHRPLFNAAWAGIPFFSSRTRALIAKEFVDLARSGALVKMTLSYSIPLIVLLLIATAIDFTQAPIPFNLLSYAPFLGFFGFNFYSWINGIDRPDPYDVLPVTVPDLIRIKVIVYLIATTWISILFLMLMAERLDQWGAFFPALIVMLANSVYIVALTAFLMGLSPNKAIFDVSIMGWFYLFTTLPLMMLFFLSFTQGDTGLLENWYAQVRTGGLDASASEYEWQARRGFSTIIAISAVLLGIGTLLLSVVGRRWHKQSFIDA